MVANLKANQNYQAVIDSTYKEPNYDLANFTEKITTNSTIVAIKNLEKLGNSNENKASEKRFWQTKAFMWSCIILGVAVIFYFVLALLKDMKRE